MGTPRTRCEGNARGSHGTFLAPAHDGGRPGMGYDRWPGAARTDDRGAPQSRLILTQFALRARCPVRSRSVNCSLSLPRISSVQVRPHVGTRGCRRGGHVGVCRGARGGEGLEGRWLARTLARLTPAERGLAQGRLDKPSLSVAAARLETWTATMSSCCAAGSTAPTTTTLACGRDGATPNSSAGRWTDCCSTSPAGGRRRSAGLHCRGCPAGPTFGKGLAMITDPFAAGGDKGPHLLVLLLVAAEGLAAAYSEAWASALTTAVARRRRRRGGWRRRRRGSRSWRASLCCGRGRDGMHVRVRSTASGGRGWRRCRSGGGRRAWDGGVRAFRLTATRPRGRREHRGPSQRPGEQTRVGVA